MRVRVLGSAAGGGFPQWNCNCPNCDGFRRGSIRATARTQSSIAISDDRGQWLLCNASPDLLSQIRGFPELQPGRSLRDTAIAAILLIDAQIDHTTGLYMLREHRSRWPLWSTAPVREDLTQGNPLLKLLEHYCGIDWHELPIDGASFEIPPLQGLRFTALPLLSNAPPYSPHRDRPVPGDNVGLLVENTTTGRRLFYAPGLGQMEDHVWAAMQRADVVLVDGTVWRDDEMIQLGASKKTGQAMGHLAQSGPGGMLEWLAKLPAKTRRILIHINNTNPILNEDGPQRAELRAAGVEVAWDGMDFSL